MKKTWKDDGYVPTQTQHLLGLMAGMFLVFGLVQLLDYLSDVLMK